MEGVLRSQGEHGASPCHQSDPHMGKLPGQRRGRGRAGSDQEANSRHGFSRRSCCHLWRHMWEVGSWRSEKLPKRLGTQAAKASGPSEEKNSAGQSASRVRLTEHAAGERWAARPEAGRGITDDHLRREPVTALSSRSSGCPRQGSGGLKWSWGAGTALSFGICPVPLGEPPHYVPMG